jgi:hypothetical protein
MAKKTVSEPTTEPTTALATWDEELAAAAKAAADQEAGAGGGQFFSVRGGALKLGGAQLPNNEMGVVILDSVLENVFYTGKFDPETPQTPDCYAFGRVEEELAPHEAAEQRQAATCAECPHNAWGSADVGRGKACKNRRRLAVLPAGSFDAAGGFTPVDDPDHYRKATQAYLGVSPTGINAYAAYVKQLATMLKRPPFGVFTRVKVVPDDKNQFKLLFELLAPVPAELLGAVLERAKGQRELTVFPYPKAAPAAEKPAGRGRAARRF